MFFHLAPASQEIFNTANSPSLQMVVSLWLQRLGSDHPASPLVLQYVRFPDKVNVWFLRHLFVPWPTNCVHCPVWKFLCKAHVEHFPALVLSHCLIHMCWLGFPKDIIPGVNQMPFPSLPYPHLTPVSISMFPSAPVTWQCLQILQLLMTYSLLSSLYLL